MTCSFDVKEYALGESSMEDARRLEAHLEDCGACRDELARMRMTQTALLAVGDEEPPRRIAFVSDKVFEPRWYQRVWNSAPQLGFLAAVMLACAIFVHALAGSSVGPAPPPRTVAAVVDTSAIEREVTARLHDAVTKAVAESEARQQKHTLELLKTAEQRYELDRRATLAAFAEQARIIQRQVANMYVTANNLRAGE